MEHTNKLENQIKEELPCCKKEESHEQHPVKSPKRDRFLGICIVISAVILGGSWIYTYNSRDIAPETANAKVVAELKKVILPAQGIPLPVTWGDLGKKMITAGIIDQKKFEDLYARGGGLDVASEQLLSGTNNGQLTITEENSGVLLNLLWALGLGNKNIILDNGPMIDKKYGGDPSKFASTGGWTLSVGSSMNHYSNHVLITLTPEQQFLVEKVSQNIYRPCCGNSTYFPDCNHGMAMLGLLELMASQGVGEEDMYKAALAVNSYWFPDTYLTIAQYMQSKGVEWNKVGAKEILSANFSSASGYQQILNQIQPATNGKGSSCGVQ